MTDEGFDPDEYTDPERLPRGFLILDVYNLCVEFLAGEVKLDDGKYLTPYWIAKLIHAANVGKAKPPSTGAISAILVRWVAEDFAVVRKNPQAFLDFTERGYKLKLGGLQREQAERRRAPKGVPTPLASKATDSVG